METKSVEAILGYCNAHATACAQYNKVQNKPLYPKKYIGIYGPLVIQK